MISLLEEEKQKWKNALIIQQNQQIARIVKEQARSLEQRFIFLRLSQRKRIRRAKSRTLREMPEFYKKESQSVNRRRR